MKKTDGIVAAKALKKKLQSKGVPVLGVYLFGSVASDNAEEHSDIDIAILCEPHLESKHKENTQFILACRDIDLRIETVCLHPEDMENKFSIIGQEVQKHGVQI